IDGSRTSVEKKFPMGCVTLETTSCNGLTIASAPSPSAPSAPSLPSRESTVIVTSETETRATTSRRVLRARVRRATANLPPGRAHQDPLEDLELLEALPGPDRDRGERVVGDVDRHAGLVAEPLVEPAKQGAAAGERDGPLR